MEYTKSSHLSIDDPRYNNRVYKEPLEFIDKTTDGYDKNYKVALDPRYRISRSYRRVIGCIVKKAY